MRWIIPLAATLLATPAMAAWEVDSSDTKKTWFYVAYEADKTGDVELQIYCDNVYPDDFQLLTFTGEDAETGDSDLPSITVDAAIDAKRFGDLQGYFDAVEGERVVVIDTSEESELRTLIAAARDAEQRIEIGYGDKSHRFGVEGLAAALDGVVEGCER